MAVRPLPDLDTAIRDPGGRALLELLCTFLGWRRQPLGEIAEHLANWYRLWAVGSDRTSGVTEVLACERRTFPHRFRQPDAQQALEAWRQHERRARVEAELNDIIANALADVWETVGTPQPVSIEVDGSRHRLMYIPALALLWTPDLFRWQRTRTCALVTERVIARRLEADMVRIAPCDDAEAGISVVPAGEMPDPETIADFCGRWLVHGDPEDAEGCSQARLAAWVGRTRLTSTQQAVLATLRDDNPELALWLLARRRRWSERTARAHRQTVLSKLAAAR